MPEAAARAELELPTGATRISRKTRNRIVRRRLPADRERKIDDSQAYTPRSVFPALPLCVAGEPGGAPPPPLTEAELKRAYRRLAMLYHPDKNPDGAARFTAVQAREISRKKRDARKREVPGKRDDHNPAHGS